MPSVSAKQHRFMAAVAHNPSFAREVGVPQSVGNDFVAADAGNPMTKVKPPTIKPPKPHAVRLASALRSRK